MAVEKLLADFQKALQRLEESMELAQTHKEYYTHFRDSAIQRFEFTLEICWKNIKVFLHEYEGVECRSPKGCLREFFHCGYVTQDELVQMLKMVDDRNLTTHTYHEEIAEELFLVLPTYKQLLQTIFETLRKRCD